MKVYKYKSLIIEERVNGLEITGKPNKDILTEIIPDALEYVKKNDLQLGAHLYGLNGVELFVLPNMRLSVLQETWKQDYYKLSGLALD